MPKTYTINEVVKEIATTVKQKIANYETSLIALRKKELEHKHGKLAKSVDLCPLCAEPEFGCSCLTKSDKLVKKTPPDISEKTMHKLKDEYGHDEKGKEKAYATAWSIENKMKKEEMAPKYSEKAGISTDSKTKARNHKVAPLGGIPMGVSFAQEGKVNGKPVLKEEMDAGLGGMDSSMGMSEVCEKCGKSGKSCKCVGKAELDKGMPTSSASALAPKAPAAATPIAHVNKELGGFKSIASKPTISSMGRAKASASGMIGKMELKTTPDKDVDDSGNGSMPKAKKLGKAEVMGATGKQPIGQGHGDAGKVAGAPHPETTAGLASVKGLSPAKQWSNDKLPALQQKLATVRGGSQWLKSTHASAARVHPKQAAPVSQRFHGAMPLQRSEMEPMGKCAMCKNEEHAGKCMKMEMPAPTEGLSAMNHNRKMLKVK
jgi:hypothetical protein